MRDKISITVGFVMVVAAGILLAYSHPKSPVIVPIEHRAGHAVRNDVWNMKGVCEDYGKKLTYYRIRRNASSIEDSFHPDKPDYSDQYSFTCE